jgi:hypothetical protein
MSSNSPTTVASSTATNPSGNNRCPCGCSVHLSSHFSKPKESKGDNAMKRMINRCASFRKKDGVYVFYVDFNFVFFKGIAAGFLDAILSSINPEEGIARDAAPEDFMSFLISKNILVEEKSL